MGILKHFILPLFAILNLKIAYDCLVPEDVDGIMPAFEPTRDLTVSPLGMFERHIVHILGGSGLCFFVNIVAAIVIENLHYRGMVLILHTLFFAVDGFSYVKLGLPVPPVVYIIVGSGLIGLTIHSQEPGIFTKDKKSKSN